MPNEDESLKNIGQIMLQAMANPEANQHAEGMEEFGIQTTAVHHTQHKKKADNIFLVAEEAMQAGSQKQINEINDRLKATIIINPNLPLE